MQTSFPKRMASLEEIFRFLDATLSSFGASPAAGYAITLALEEIFTNLVKYDPGGDGAVTISLEKQGPLARVSVRSPGARPFDLTRASLRDPSLPLAQRTPGGLGILLTREMVDDLRYSYADRCSTITFTKKLDA